MALPEVPARYTVAPTGGDDTRLIQAALDYNDADRLAVEIGANAG